MIVKSFCLTNFNLNLNFYINVRDGAITIPFKPQFLGRYQFLV